MFKKICFESEDKSFSGIYLFNCDGIISLNWTQDWKDYELCEFVATKRHLGTPTCAILGRPRAPSWDATKRHLGTPTRNRIYFDSRDKFQGDVG